ncbi:4'-phosphopantetheinyl transferase family protein [Kitasatospora sp. DSM 101779]|uniref:4'-phosphopantetheinyl transferase family protein n=1 Tax=Kitasatospora sp. DSM 101779 TaxID=2853165 RepID=UPI0021D7D326|nr:4'-phosphopantetheinyl transferase superfamily protein [Kitasatospora sp. DSM 101779]MCU7824239.1 4'-phosphopantetheinyl transferase superfamily protein [Kitasatospora sp. DSM 101779]
MPARDGHLWLLPEAAAEAFAARHGGPALLGAEERARLARLRGEGARRRFLGGRVLARYALSARSGRPLGGWRVRTAPDGRPEPEPPADGLRFNLSHTDGMVACLVATGRDCGVDVEAAAAGADAVRHLPRWFAADERAAVDAVPAAERPARVAAYWVLKEAYLKAVGTGLRRELADFSFTPPDGRPIRLTDPARPAAENAAWHFELIHPAPGFVLAAAVQDGRGGRIHRTLIAP